MAARDPPGRRPVAPGVAPGSESPGAVRASGAGRGHRRSPTRSCLDASTGRRRVAPRGARSRPDSAAPARSGSCSGDRSSAGATSSRGSRPAARGADVSEVDARERVVPVEVRRRGGARPRPTSVEAGRPRAGSRGVRPRCAPQQRAGSSPTTGGSQLDGAEAAASAAASGCTSGQHHPPTAARNVPTRRRPASAGPARVPSRATRASAAGHLVQRDARGDAGVQRLGGAGHRDRDQRVAQAPHQAGQAAALGADHQHQRVGRELQRGSATSPSASSPTTKQPAALNARSPGSGSSPGPPGRGPRRRRETSTPRPSCPARGARARRRRGHRTPPRSGRRRRGSAGR